MADPIEVQPDLASLTEAVRALANHLTTPPAELLTRAQVADVLGISLSAFTDLEARGFVGPEAIRSDPRDPGDRRDRTDVRQASMRQDLPYRDSRQDLLLDVAPGIVHSV